MDPIGILPIFVGLTRDLPREAKLKLALEAVTTALLIGLSFVVAGHYIFSILGITAADFRIAGGLLLLIISIREIFGSSVKNSPGEIADNFMGIVPLGTPMIAGPAMMTTLIMLHDEHSYFIVTVSLLVNLLITYFLLVFADKIVNRVGEATSRGTAKVVAIFLAAIGIMMIRKGVETIFIK